ncbi:hypothetical protein SAMN03159341_11518 [Paenibacillus sp. 1_12]|nr:hypothetical protein SAMN03159341_11518 [Paenibacillus sp. 1_12]
MHKKIYAHESRDSPKYSEFQLHICRIGVIRMNEEKEELVVRIVDRQFAGEQKLESILFQWLKKQMDGEQK